MRIRPEDKFWVCIDPTPDSEPVDILFETDLAGLERQFKGGLSMELRPAIFTSVEEAEVEANTRMTALRAIEAIRRHGEGVSLAYVRTIRLLDADGNVVFEANMT